jgi:HSP20 family protein
MTLIHYRNPFAYGGNGHSLRTFDEIVDELIGTGNHFNDRICKPAANIYESDNEFRIEVAVPGLTRDQIRVTLDDDVLKLHAGKASEENIEADHAKFEFDYPDFKRTFIIPDTVDRERITSRYHEGILYIYLPKKEDQIKKGPKEIKIK